MNGGQFSAWFCERDVFSLKMLNSLLKSTESCDNISASYDLFSRSVFRVSYGSCVPVQSLYEIILFLEDCKA